MVAIGPKAGSGDDAILENVLMKEIKSFFVDLELCYIAMFRKHVDEKIR